MRKFLSKRVLLTIMALLVLVLIGAGINAYNTLNQPVSSRSFHILKDTTKPIGGVSLEPKTFNTKYAQFDYPAVLRPRPTQKASVPSLINILFTASNIEVWVLAINISLSNNGIKGSSDYLLRAEDPSHYSPAQLVINGMNILVMNDIKSSGFAEVAFLSHNNMVATVSLTGDSSQGLTPLQQSFSMVLDHWTWH